MYGFSQIAKEIFEKQIKHYPSVFTDRGGSVVASTRCCLCGLSLRMGRLSYAVWCNSEAQLLYLEFPHDTE